MGAILMLIIMYPFFLIFFVPAIVTCVFLDLATNKGKKSVHTCKGWCSGLAGFIIGLGLDIIFVPIALFLTVIGLIFLFFVLLAYVSESIINLCYETKGRRDLRLREEREA